MEPIPEEPSNSSREHLDTYAANNANDPRAATPPAVSPVTPSDRSLRTDVSRDDIAYGLFPTWNPSGQYQEARSPNEASLLHPAVRDAAESWDDDKPDAPAVRVRDTGPRIVRRQRSQIIWNPIWLHTTVLICFALVFMLCSLATGLMYHFSQIDLGLSSQTETHEYGWKYGPTAVLVAFSLLWQMVDLSTRSLMPWQELHWGLACVQKTLLLDYLSPILPVRLWVATRNRHWAVVATTTGHLLLLLLTVFSTGLLVLESTEVSLDDVSFVAGQLNANDYNLDNVTASSASLFYGVQFQNLSYPLGTSVDTVVPTFTRQNTSSGNQVGSNGSTYHATVPGVAVDFECETLDIQNGTKTFLPWFSIRAPFFVVNVTTPSCTVLNNIVGEGPDHGYSHVPNATQNYQGWARNVVCNGGYDYSLPSGNDTGARGIGPAPVPDGKADNRVLITMADLRYDPTDDVPEYIWIEDITAALCKPSYSINTYEVSYAGDFSTEPGATMNKIASTADTIPGFLPGDLGDAVLLAAYRLYLGPGGDDYVLSRQVPTFFQMNQLLQNNATLKTFMDPSVLNSTSATTFKGIATQLLHEMIQPGNANSNTVSGSITYNQDRLHVKAPSTGVLCGGFALLVAISISMIFIRPHNVVSREPGSVLATAEVLLSSPDLRNILSGLGAAPLSRLREALAGLQFTSHWVPETGTFGIDASTGDEEKRASEDSAGKTTSHKDVQWWQPFSTKAWFLVLAIVIPLIFIGVLEGVQHISDQQNGFVEVRARDSQVLASYIPASLAVCVVGMYSSIEYAVATFAPFATLRDGNAPASRSVALTYLVASRPHVWLQSLRNRHWGLSVILVTNFVAAFLTIVISGLYSGVNLSSATSTSLLATDRFDLSKTDISIDDQRAGAINNLITYSNISYPAWTYDSLAFPRLSLPDTTSLDTTPASLSLKTTATRALLNCTIMTDRGIAVEQIPTNVSYYQLKGMQNPGLFLNGYVILHVQGSLPWSLCDHPPANASSAAAAVWHQYFYVRNDSTVSRVGKATLLRWDLDSNAVFGDGVVETNPDAGEAATGADGVLLDAFGCPSIAVTLGYASSATGKAAADLGTLVCWQNVQQVDADLTLEYPGLQISQDDPPRVDESGARLVPAQSGGPAYGFPVNNLMLTLDQIPADGGGVWQPWDNVDRFVAALVSGRDGRPVGELAGQNNTDALRDAAQGVYGRYMAQAISNNMRVGVDAAAGSGSSSLSTTTMTATSMIASSGLASGTLSSSGIPAGSIVMASKPAPTSTTDTGISSSAASIETAADTSTVSTAAATTTTTTTTTTAAAAVTTTTTAAEITITTTPVQRLRRDHQTLHARADTPTPTTYTAQLSRTEATARLQQNRGPKIALQAMLGAMVLGAAATILLMRVRQVLPHAPYSVAGLAALVVDGGLDGSSGHVVNNGPYRPVSQVDEELELEEWVRSYTLGWWAMWDGTERFGVRRLDVGVDELLMRGRTREGGGE